MLRRLYDRTLALAGHRRAPAALAGISFIESSVFPIPPDALLVPMAIARPDRAFFYATICTIASVLGGMLGYAIGYFLYEGLAEPILAFYGYAAEFADFAARYNDYGAWIVFGAGVTPFPYKVITIASGATKLDFAVFTIASVLARGLRFYLEAALLWKFGTPIRDFVEKHLQWVTTAAFVLLIGGFIAIRFFR